MVDNVTVTREDREAAADYCADRQYLPGWVKAMREGKHDNMLVVQAFARHRLASIARLSPAPEGVDAREYARGIEDAARFIEAHPMWVDGKSVGTDMRPASRADLAKGIRALSRPPAEQVRMREALEKITEFARSYFEPWGSWKTAWWEGEVSDEAAFCGDNALKHAANIASAALTPHPKGQNDG